MRARIVSCQSAKVAMANPRKRERRAAESLLAFLDRAQVSLWPLGTQLVSVPVIYIVFMTACVCGHYACMCVYECVRICVCLCVCSVQ